MCTTFIWEVTSHVSLFHILHFLNHLSHFFSVTFCLRSHLISGSLLVWRVCLSQHIAINRSWSLSHVCLERSLSLWEFNSQEESITSLLLEGARGNSTGVFQTVGGGGSWVWEVPRVIRV